MYVGSLDKSVIIWEMPKDIMARSQAEESLRGRQDKVDHILNWQWGRKVATRNCF